MKRLVLFVAIVGWPLAAAAQVAPPAPPAPPVPVPAPAPVAAPAPPTPPSRAPRPVMAPVYVDDFAIREAVIAAREAQQIDVRAAQEEARAAAEAAREAQRAAADHMREMKFVAPAPMLHFDNHFTFQDRPFSFTFGQEGEGRFSSGQSHLGQRQYERAIVEFDRAIAQKSARADAAYYYKAYAQFRLGKTDDALTTIAALRKEYPQSRYLNDAKVLEADARRLKPADIVDDDEIKLLAISAMQQAEAERAVPLLEEVLNKNNSLAVKKRALYVLALKSDQPRARQILLGYAKGGGNPDLQLEAIRYIAQNKDQKTTASELQQIYQATTDTAVKMAIISAFRSSGNMPALVSIANTPNTPIAIRQSAISGISSIGGPQDLWALYQKEENKELRLQMIGAFGSMQALDQLNQILKTEKDPEVRRRAVRSLGSLRSEQTGKMLVDMYGAETDIETRQAVITALGNQNNAEALVAIARKETNVQVKTSIVRKLTDLASRSKVAADYLMELIKG